MYDVVVYLSSLAKIADRNRKTECLTAFAEGAQRLGLRTLVQTEMTVVPARLGVILGWVGTTLRGPHIQLRQNVIDSQRVMSIDGSCFKFADRQNKFLRYSLDGVFYNTNNYSNLDSGSEKWNRIQQELNLEYRPWRTNGNHILICGQRDGGWSMKGTNMETWLIDTVKKIRTVSSRPIVVRPHPFFPVNPSKFFEFDRVSVSNKMHLAQDLEGAWAAVFFNSSSSVAAALHGIPLFCEDSDCVSYKVSSDNINLIETPVMPVRDQWLWDLCAAHWTDEESQQGLIWQKFEQYL